MAGSFSEWDKMGYAQKKGYENEIEFAGYLDDIFKFDNFKFQRIGNAETNKMTLHGDVIIDSRTDRDEKCFLRRYFLEAKCHAQPNLFDILTESEKNAQKYSKHGSIAYIVKQKKGHKREGTIVAMSTETFRRICRELQGYINEENLT